MVSAAVFQRSHGFPIAFRCGSDHGQLCVGVTAAQQRKRHDRRNNERDESSFSHIFLSIFSYFVGRSDFPSNRSKSAHFSCKMFDIFRVSGHFPSMKSLFYVLIVAIVIFFCKFVIAHSPDLLNGLLLYNLCIAKRCVYVSFNFHHINFLPSMLK